MYNITNSGKATSNVLPLHNIPVPALPDTSMLHRLRLGMREFRVFCYLADHKQIGLSDDGKQYWSASRSLTEIAINCFRSDYPDSPLGSLRRFATKTIESLIEIGLLIKEYRNEVLIDWGGNRHRGKNETNFYIFQDPRYIDPIERSPQARKSVSRKSKQKKAGTPGDLGGTPQATGSTTTINKSDEKAAIAGIPDSSLGCYTGCTSYLDNISINNLLDLTINKDLIKEEEYMASANALACVSTTELDILNFPDPREPREEKADPGLNDVNRNVPVFSEQRKTEKPKRKSKIVRYLKTKDDQVGRYSELLEEWLPDLFFEWYEIWKPFKKIEREGRGEDRKGAMIHWGKTLKAYERFYGDRTEVAREIIRGTLAYRKQCEIARNHGSRLGLPDACRFLVGKNSGDPYWMQAIEANPQVTNWTELPEPEAFERIWDRYSKQAYKLGYHPGDRSKAETEWFFLVHENPEYVKEVESCLDIYFSIKEAKKANNQNPGFRHLYTFLSLSQDGNWKDVNLYKNRQKERATDEQREWFNWALNAGLLKDIFLSNKEVTKLDGFVTQWKNCDRYILVSEAMKERPIGSDTTSIASVSSVSQKASVERTDDEVRFADPAKQAYYDAQKRREYLERKGQQEPTSSVKGNTGSVLSSLVDGFKSKAEDSQASFVEVVRNFGKAVQELRELTAEEDLVDQQKLEEDRRLLKECERKLYWGCNEQPHQVFSRVIGLQFKGHEAIQDDVTALVKRYQSGEFFDDDYYGFELVKTTD